MSATGSSPEQPGGGIQMTEGIMGIIQPAIERLDAQVHNTRASQYALNAQIQALAQCKYVLSFQLVLITSDICDSSNTEEPEIAFVEDQRLLRKGLR